MLTLLQRTTSSAFVASVCWELFSSSSMRTLMQPGTPKLSEDWMAVCVGLLLFGLALFVLAGADLLGWAVTTSVWTDMGRALAPASPTYAGLPGWMSLGVTFAFLLVLLSAAALGLGARLPDFLRGFLAVFTISYACMILGSWAYIAATPDKLQALNIPWSLHLTPEAGLVLALAAGLLIGNFFPRFSGGIREAVRADWYIKTGIVLLGGFVGIAAAERMELATVVMFRGLCAVVEAYLIYWALVYLVSRKFFKFPREWSVPLASGISICGVSAAIATGAAIGARPIIPIMVSSLVVIFAVIELLLLPFLAQLFLYAEPMVAAAWMGLAVKTDGAAVASGAITEALIQAKAQAAGFVYEPNWILGTTTTIKVFIDGFIGVWAFLLALIWCTKIEKREGVPVRARQIWERFPKFILGYVATFAAMLAIGMASPDLLARGRAAMGQANLFRGIFFAMTFFSIGVVSDFKKLWGHGFAKLAAVYVLCLFGFIIWIGLFISWLFFHGVKPPLVAG
jgi:uncharacterized membrane protein YadS